MKTNATTLGRRAVRSITVALAIAVAGPVVAQDNDRGSRREAREERRDERQEERQEKRAERREERRDDRVEAIQDARREALQERRQDRFATEEARRQQLHHEDRREVRQERREIRRDVRHDRREDRREVRQDRREDRQQAWRYQQLYEQRLIEQQRRWLAYANHDRYYRTPSSHRYRLGGRYWQTNRYGAELLREAANHGYAEGIRAGRADRYDGWRFDYRNSWAYREGSYGYNGRYIRRDHYSHYFREGFRRGYEDGYYGRSRYGRHDSGQYFMIGAILSAILGLESI